MPFPPLFCAPYQTMKDASKKLNDLFEGSLGEAKVGFRVALTMDAILFVVGIGLIIAAVAQVRGGLF